MLVAHYIAGEGSSTHAGLAVSPHMQVLQFHMCCAFEKMCVCNLIKEILYIPYTICFITHQCAHYHTHHHTYTHTQEEKARIKEKADTEKAIKDRAAISVELVDEHKDDIEHARKISFGPSSSQDRRLRRLQIKAHPVLTTPKSTRTSRAASKRQRTLLLEACSKAGGVSVGGARQLSKKLGVVRRDSKTSSSAN